MSCSGAEPRQDHIDIRDDLGNTLSFSKTPERVISLVPSITELIVAVGAQNRLVARTRFDTDPKIAQLPSIGGALDPNIEAMVALRPDLVVTWLGLGGQPLAERLQQIGIPIYPARSETLIDFRRHARTLGRVLEALQQADSVVDHIDRELARLGQLLQAAPHPSVLYVVWHDPPMTVGAGTFIDLIITLAGGTNLFGDVATRWPQVSLEEILIRDPDVLVVQAGDERDSASTAWLHNTPGWRDLRAVRTGRYLVAEDDLFSRPGPRVVDAATRLALFLHPDRQDAIMPTRQSDAPSEIPDSETEVRQ